MVPQADTGHSRLHIGHAWSAFGRHTTEFQRRWHGQHPDTDLRLIRHNTPTGGLAEGLCDLAVIRTPIDLKPWAHAVIGHETRYVALASDDPWARRRGIRLAEIPDRTLAIDRRTGTTTLGLWRRTTGPGSSTPRTSTTGWPPSPPDAASASPHRPPRPSTGATASATGRCATPIRYPST